MPRPHVLPDAAWSRRSRPTKLASRLRTSPTSESRGLGLRSLRLRFSATHQLKFVWWDCIKRRHSRGRATIQSQAIQCGFRCNSSQCVPDSSAQCLHTGEHYIRLETGFARSIMSYDIYTLAERQPQRTNCFHMPALQALPGHVSESLPHQHLDTAREATTSRRVMVIGPSLPCLSRPSIPSSCRIA